MLIVFPAFITAGCFLPRRMSVKDDFHQALILSPPDHEPTHVCKEEASVGIVRVALGLTALVMEPRKWFCYFFLLCYCEGPLGLAVLGGSLDPPSEKRYK